MIHTHVDSRFRPLAGFWFLNDYYSFDQIDGTPYGFPSPCGVLVLKWYALASDMLGDNRFRPLAGFWFLNTATSRRQKSLSMCFRPLAGFWFLNYQSEYS